MSNTATISTAIIPPMMGQVISGAGGAGAGSGVGAGGAGGGAGGFGGGGATTTGTITVKLPLNPFTVTVYVPASFLLTLKVIFWLVPASMVTLLSASFTPFILSTTV